MAFVGGRLANPSAAKRLPGRVNYLIGRDPQKWRRNVPTYAAVTGHELYPGIGLTYYSHRGRLEYDLKLAPGADPSQIALRYPGADDIRLDGRGDLVVRVAGHETRQLRPVAYQLRRSARVAVSARYVVADDGMVRLTLGRYDQRRPLIIDPVLVYSASLGGSRGDAFAAVDVGSDGSTYLAGDSWSNNFPLVNAQKSTNTTDDAVITKLAPNGSIVYSTYYGGDTEVDYATAAKVDGSGALYVAGGTWSTDLPTVNAFQTTNPVGPHGEHNEMGFLAKLSPDGSGLQYSTYFGSPSATDSTQGHRHDTEIDALALDGGGSAYAAGFTKASDLPTKNAFQSVYGSQDDATSTGQDDAFVTKFAPDGRSLVYSTYLGGSGNDSGENAGVEWDYGLAVDDSGAAYVTGATASADFPTTAGAFQLQRAGCCAGSENAVDGFVTKLAPDGRSLAYSTYLGGSRFDLPFGIAVDSDENAYVVGRTFSLDFPTAAPLASESGTGFVSKLTPDGAGVAYSTQLGGSRSAYGGSSTWLYSVAVDASFRAHVAGETCAGDYPVVNPIHGSGNCDAVVSVFGSEGTSLAFSTYLGESDAAARGIALGRDGGIYLGGHVKYGTPNEDGYVAKISAPTPTISGTPREGETLTVELNNWLATAPQSYTYQWQDCDPGGTACVDILGETDSTYQLTGSDVGTVLRVVVQANWLTGLPTSVASPMTPPIAPLTEDVIDVLPFDDPAEPQTPPSADVEPCDLAPTEPAGTYCGENDALNPMNAEVGTEPALDDDPAADPVAVASNLHRGSYGMSDNILRSEATFMFGRPHDAAAGTVGCPVYSARTPDSRYRALGLTKVRLIVPWNVMAGKTAGTGSVLRTRYCATREWIQGALASPNTQVLVSFEVAEDSRTCMSCPAPALSDYDAMMRAFLDEFPAVREFTAWNEPNQGNQPTRADPYRAGRYWRILNYLCTTVYRVTRPCIVAAGDFLDNSQFLVPDPSAPGGTRNDEKAYWQRYLRGAGGSAHPPVVWAFHAYGSGIYHRPGRLKRFLQWSASLGQPHVWLTEQGGIVYVHKGSGFPTPTAPGPSDFRGEARSGPGSLQNSLSAATADVDYLLNDLPHDLAAAGVARRVTRFYYYDWRGSPYFDSGLVPLNHPRGATRPIYDKLKAKTNP